MTRPQIIRADTLDLQDQHSPSAQDHTRQPAHPAPLGIGSAAPHQAAAVRHATQERSAEEHLLGETWSETNTLHEEPASDDERTLHDNGDDERHLQRDELAVRQNGGMSGSDDADLADADVDDGLEDDNMDRISSSPSIDDEDIDFDFVYALHTFQAVVEGQANATKGDTMVLLDDSNSYWWLVRIVKDGSIGYLPAEHIETPTERLARLNKHRNIDLSATMLGDNTEKSKNPLKKAMRRRNAKTVTFTAPTYVEASDYDYSSDEDETGDVPMTDAEPQAAQEQKADDTEQKDDGMAVEPLKINGTKKDKKDTKKEKDAKKEAKKELRKDSRKDKQINEDEKADAPRESNEEKRKLSGESSDHPRTSDEIFDQPLNPKVSKNGTVRNTDSFFKDENAETRKITLTPMLFRDDNSSGSSRSIENKERSSSLDIVERAEKSKDDKKRKEKKPGMLSGLFKRKDKKKGVAEGVDDEKISEELQRGSPQPKTSEDTSLEKIETDLPQRQPSKGKLQKMQPRSGDVSPPKRRQPEQTGVDSPEPTVQQAAITSNKSNVQGATTMRVVSPTPEPERPAALRIRSPEHQDEKVSSGTANSSMKVDDTTRDPSQNGHQMKLEDNLASSTVAGRLGESESRNAPQTSTRHIERLSESPVQISPIDDSDPNKPPGLVGDNSSQDEPSISPVSSSSSPSLIDLPVDTPSSSTVIIPRNHQLGQQTMQSPVGPPPARPAPTPVDSHNLDKSRLTPSPAPSGPMWSDAHLRTYFEDGSDVRDLLLVIHDTSGVVPVSHDHPIMAGLFKEEKGQLGAMGRALDGLLVDWLDNRRKTS